MRFCTRYLSTSTSKDWSSTPITMASESRGPHSCGTNTPQNFHPTWWLIFNTAKTSTFTTKQKNTIRLQTFYSHQQCLSRTGHLDIDPWSNIFLCKAVNSWKQIYSCKPTMHNRLSPAHLDKHAKVELRAELLDPLGQRLLVITVGRLFLDLCCWQAQVRSTFCTHGETFKKNN